MVQYAGRSVCGNGRYGRSWASQHFLCGVLGELRVLRSPDQEVKQESTRAHAPVSLEAGLKARTSQKLHSIHWPLRLGHLVTHTYDTPLTLE